VYTPAVAEGSWWYVNKHACQDADQFLIEWAVPCNQSSQERAAAVQGRAADEGETSEADF
jgi:hypothetical protein